MNAGWRTGALAIAALAVGFAAARFVAPVHGTAPRAPAPPRIEPAPPPTPQVGPPPATAARQFEGEVRGAVRTDRGFPIRGATVAWKADGGPDAPAPQTTGDDGRFVFPGAAAEDVSLIVRVPPDVYPDVVPPERADPPRRAPGRREIALELRLPDGSEPRSAHCHVTRPSGSTYWDWTPGRTMSDDATGDLRVLAGDACEFAGGPVRHTGGASRVRVNLVRREGVIVEMRAPEGFEGFPVHLRVRNRDGDALDPDATFGDFRFSRTDRPPTRLRFLELTPGEYDVGLSIDGVIWSSDRVRIAPGTERVALGGPVPDPASIVTVEVRTADGDPVDAKFRLRRKSPRSAFESSVETVAVRDGVGAYRVLRSSPSATETESETDAGQRDATWTLEVTPEQGPAMNVDLPYGVARVDARPLVRTVVVRVAGDPDVLAPGADLVVIVEPAGRGNPFYGDRDRQSPRRPVRKGATLEVEASGSSPLRVVLATRFSGGGGFVVAERTLEAGTVRAEATLELPRLHALTIDAGRSRGRGRVGLRQSAGHGDLGYAHASLDGAGRFTFAGLPEGRYAVSIDDESRDVEVPATKELRWD